MGTLTVFVTDTECVYCAVRIETLNIIHVSVQRLTYGQ